MRSVSGLWGFTVKSRKTLTLHDCKCPQWSGLDVAFLVIFHLSLQLKKKWKGCKTLSNKNLTSARTNCRLRFRQCLCAYRCWWLFTHKHELLGRNWFNNERVSNTEGWCGNYRRHYRLRRLRTRSHPMVLETPTAWSENRDTYAFFRAALIIMHWPILRINVPRIRSRRFIIAQKFVSLDPYRF